MCNGASNATEKLINFVHFSYLPFRETALPLFLSPETLLVDLEKIVLFGKKNYTIIGFHALQKTNLALGRDAVAEWANALLSN